MNRPQHRLEPAGERSVGQQTIQMHRDFGDPDPLPLGRDRRMQIAQHGLIPEPRTFRHEAGDQIQNAIGPVDEAPQDLPAIHAIGLRPSFIEHAFRPSYVLARRQVQEREKVTRLVVRSLLLELRLALGVDEGRRGIWKHARRIGSRRMALRLDEDGPTRSQTADRVVEAGSDGHELGLDRALQIRPPKPRRPLQRAVLVEDDALIDERGPGQEVGKTDIGAAIFGEIEHDRPH